jgi:hypothetical protein
MIELKKKFYSGNIGLSGPQGLPGPQGLTGLPGQPGPVVSISEHIIIFKLIEPLNYRVKLVYLEKKVVIQILSITFLIKTIFYCRKGRFSGKDWRDRNERFKR